MADIEGHGCNDPWPFVFHRTWKRGRRLRNVDTSVLHPVVLKGFFLIQDEDLSR